MIDPINLPFLLLLQPNPENLSLRAYPRVAIQVLGQHAAKLGVSLEVQVFGRASFALSARCYHARAHNRIKDNCQFVCEEDLNGMPLNTLSGREFLTVNGIQTLSRTYLNLLPDLNDLQAAGVSKFRLVPHTGYGRGGTDIPRRARRENLGHRGTNLPGSHAIPCRFLERFLAWSAGA